MENNYIQLNNFRDPEFLFYDGHEYVVNIYSIKPAVFDLFLAMAIAAYLGALYLFLVVSNEYLMKQNVSNICKLTLKVI